MGTIISAGRALAAALTCAAVTSLAPPAQAQDIPLYEELGLGLFIVSSSTNLTTYGLSTYGLVRLIMDLSAGDEASAELFRRYLDDNRDAMAQTIALGGGDCERDLAMLFHVPERDRAVFARALRRRRAELLPLVTSRHVAREDAVAFTRIVLDEMRRAPALREHTRALTRG